MVSTLLSLLAGLLVGTLLTGYWSHRRLQAELLAVQAPLQTRCEVLQEQLTQAQTSLQSATDAHKEAGEALQQLQVEQARTQEKTAAIPRLEEALRDKEEACERLQEEGSRQQTTIAELELKLTNERRQTTEKLALLENAKEELSNQFKVLAQGILEEKSERFTKQNKTQLDEILKPFKTQLGDFRKRVDDVYTQDTKDRTSLHTQIVELQKLNQQLSGDAINLTRALKGDSKTQGNWGELVLERILEESGLQEGREYRREVSVTSEDGSRRRPDVVINLPEDKHVVVDSKVSLTAYESFCAAQDDSEREKLLKEHIQSMRTHIRGLSATNYEDLPGLRTLGYILMFVPVEPAFLLAMQEDKTLFLDAFNQNIMIVSPTTLLLTLRTIDSIWRNEEQNRNAMEIARQAGNLYDKFVGFVETLEDVGDKLNKARLSYEKATGQLSSGRGNLVGKTQSLKKLGIKSKKELPAHYLDAALIAEGDAEPQLLEKNATPDVN
ncbi:MAG: DNA recombination protein RmuC [Myxococcota bacterium]|nr:DNA recombination protein RmuC [Myxococcota bacterium]